MNLIYCLSEYIKTNANIRITDYHGKTIYKGNNWIRWAFEDSKFEKIKNSRVTCVYGFDYERYLIIEIDVDD